MQKKNIKRKLEESLSLVLPFRFLSRNVNRFYTLQHNIGTRQLSQRRALFDIDTGFSVMDLVSCGRCRLTFCNRFCDNCYFPPSLPRRLFFSLLFGMSESFKSKTNLRENYYSCVVFRTTLLFIPRNHEESKKNLIDPRDVRYFILFFRLRLFWRALNYTNKM